MTNPQNPGPQGQGPQNIGGPVPGPQTSGQPYAGPPSQPWTGMTPGQGFGTAPGGVPQGFAPVPPARPSFLSTVPKPYLAAAASGVPGLVTFFMGFVGWISVSETIEDKADTWARDMNGTFDIPAFFSPSLILSPGWFFLLLGAVALSSFGLVAPKWRRFLPLLTFMAIVGWLGIFVCAVSLPSFVGLGAGAYVALVLGFIQMALLATASLMVGLRETDQR